jgi:hypothetical protein
MNQLQVDVPEAVNEDLFTYQDKTFRQTDVQDAIDEAITTSEANTDGGGIFFLLEALHNAFISSVPTAHGVIAAHLLTDSTEYSADPRLKVIERIIAGLIIDVANILQYGNEASNRIIDNDKAISIIYRMVRRSIAEDLGGRLYSCSCYKALN